VYVFTFAVNKDSKRREKFVSIKIIKYHAECLSLRKNLKTVAVEARNRSY